MQFYMLHSDWESAISAKIFIYLKLRRHKPGEFPYTVYDHYVL
jgi:hypothetical protein